jgi:outer membrane protein OmpA-like peptidoglycan-associated protein
MAKWIYLLVAQAGLSMACGVTCAQGEISRTPSAEAIVRSLSTNEGRLNDSRSAGAEAPSRGWTRTPDSAPDVRQYLCGGSAAIDPVIARNLTVGPVVNLDVKFDYDDARLTPAAEKVLAEAGKALNHKELAVAKFLIAGHTDHTGGEDYNLRLSCRRAQAVQQYLEAVHGVRQDRLVLIGYGFSRLIDPDNPAGHLNRRVELRRVTP